MMNRPPPPKFEPIQTPHVVFQPQTYRSVQKGIHTLVAAVRPTLGPLPRNVAIEKMSTNSSPELLDNGGVIARRIIELQDPDEDIGAMLARGFLWELHEKAGDGTATAAVIFEKIFDGGVHYLSSGGNAMRLNLFLNEGLKLILETLESMSSECKSRALLQNVAETICYEPQMAKMLGEIMGIVGAYGQVQIRRSQRGKMDREYVEGVYWEKGLASRNMITDHVERRTDLENPAILISNLDMEDPVPLAELLDRAGGAGSKQFLIIASKFSEKTLGMLTQASRDPEKFRATAVILGGATAADQANMMKDIALLTGGQPVIKEAGQSLSGVRLEQLGAARRAWGNLEYFGVVGGKGDPKKLRRHIAELRSSFSQSNKAEDRQHLQKRIGQLIGGSATLYVDAAVDSQYEARKELANRTIQALRGAMMEGILPGGGTAYLACRSLLQERLIGCMDIDERAAYRILNTALEEPFRTLMANAGFNPDQVMTELKYAPSGSGFDIRNGKIVAMKDAHLYDPAAVVKMAVRSAVSSAALTLTVDVVCHRRKPKLSNRP